MPFFLNQDWPGFKDRPIMFIDFEMTGLNVNSHEIIEVAALLVRPPHFTIDNSYYSKVAPQHIATADPRALELLHYSPQAWQDAIPLRQMLQDLTAFAPNCFLAGWSVQNEWNFLIHALEQEKMPYFFDEKMIEVWSLAYAKLYTNQTLDRLSLANTCKLFKIPIDQHKPDSDIRATYEIFKRLVLPSKNPANDFSGGV
jgi:DNA polymerase III alpha subunit (gram-positive type)